MDLIRFFYNDLPAPVKGRACNIMGQLHSSMPSEMRKSVSVRFLEQLSNVTADAIHNYVLFFSDTVFAEVLAVNGYTIWSYFLEAYRIWAAYEVRELQLETADQSYMAFLRLLRLKYPQYHITYNYHILQHMSDNIRKFGPSFTSWWFVCMLCVCVCVCVCVCLFVASECCFFILP